MGTVTLDMSMSQIAAIADVMVGFAKTLRNAEERKLFVSIVDALLLGLRTATAQEDEPVEEEHEQEVPQLYTAGCLFCRSQDTAVNQQKNGRFAVLCSGCGANGPSESTPERAAGEWNEAYCAAAPKEADLERMAQN